MAPSGKFNRASVSQSLTTIDTVLPTYYCICGEYILVGNVQLAQLAQRPDDQAFVLRNYASEGSGTKHVYKLNANKEKEAVYVPRPTENGQKGLEKRWRCRCPRCELPVAYEIADPRDKKQGNCTYILYGALSEEQTAVPTGAFGDEPPEQ